MSNQVFINQTEKFATGQTEVKTIFVSKYENSTDNFDTTGDLVITFRKNGNIVHAEIPPIEVFISASITNRLISVEFVPVGLRNKGQIKLPIVVKTGSVVSGNMGHIQIDPADGRISIFIEESFFTVGGAGGCEATNITYVADDAN